MTGDEDEDMLAVLERDPAPLLLRSVTRHGRIGGRLSGTAVNDLVKRCAGRAGLPDAHLYSAHSLRAGGATSAYKRVHRSP